ncbi:MAG TPA: ParB N-terminal domain-containing protein [Candidatus Dormibacteraeota bacterium]
MPEDQLRRFPQGSDSDPTLRWLPVDRIEPCPIQPRYNVLTDHVDRLVDSMADGLHEPVIEVEPLPGALDRYQIVCGEQRWRAARQAGRPQLLARVLPPLNYWERFRKQIEENRLRAPLDPVEEARAILLAKSLQDITVAERLLGDAGVPFVPLEERRITDRDGFHQHLADLKRRLVESGVHVVRAGDELVCRPLSAWRTTEQLLGISEAGRKQKIGILRLPPDLQEEARQLPAEHAIQISRLKGEARQVELIRRAPELTHRQVRDAIDRLRRDPDLPVDQVLQVAAAERKSPDPLSFEEQLDALADLCRQLTRRVGLLRSRLQPAQRDQVRALLQDLVQVVEDLG